MANHEIETQWMGKMQFNSLVNGHTIIMDGPTKVGGEDNGPIPKPLILTALSGCSGMDVIAILRKAQKEVADLNIQVIGELSKVQPIEYISIHMIYIVKGDDTHSTAALDAVTLSQEKLCGVSHMLKKALPLTWEVIYNDALLFSNKTQIKIQDEHYVI